VFSVEAVQCVFLKSAVIVVVITVAYILKSNMIARINNHAMPRTHTQRNTKNQHNATKFNETPNQHNATKFRETHTQNTQTQHNHTQTGSNAMQPQTIPTTSTQ